MASNDYVNLFDLTYDFINPFGATGLFLYPLKTSENQRFLMFSGGIERYQWHQMG